MFEGAYIDGIWSMNHFFAKSLKRNNLYLLMFLELKMVMGSLKLSADNLNNTPPTPSHVLLSPAPTAKL